MKNIYEIIESFCVSFIIITILILFAFRFVEVDGLSMSNTLMDKEKLLVTNMFYTPEKGDIIVIDKSNYFGKSIVKRVIATEGDTIFIDYNTGDVYVNDILLKEEYIKEKINPQATENLSMKIKEGHVFVMGDNRNGSSDSRLEEVGQINEKNILGKAIFIVSPFSKAGVLK